MHRHEPPDLAVSVPCKPPGGADPKLENPRREYGGSATTAEFG
jgi:hypothetical protein